MKSLFRSVFINFFTLFLIASTTGSIYYAKSFMVLFYSALSLSIFNLIVKPILNLLLMPINLLTLGASKWLINVMVLYLVTIFVTDFKILSFNFPGMTFSGFTVPPVSLAFFWTLFLVSFLIEVISGFIYWLIK